MIKKQYGEEELMTTEEVYGIIGGVIPKTL